MGICHDFHQLPTIAAKLEHLHEARESIDVNLRYADFHCWKHGVP
jgi:hypothetical protein